MRGKLSEGLVPKSLSQVRGCEQSRVIGWELS